MKLMSWRPLEKGDIVDIIAPGMKPLPGVLAKSEKFLKSWGLRPRVPKDILGRDTLCANTRSYRAQHLIKAIKAKDSKAIWCIRGGYGSFQLLGELKKLRRPPCKIFLGLSDCTSLHTFMGDRWAWSTIHGSNIDRFGLGKVGPREARELQRILFGLTTEISFKLRGINEAARQTCTLTGPVVGGNLITLQANFGGPFQLQTRGRILFFEDVGERGYRVDRVLEHMDQLGMFQRALAVVFGQFTGGHEAHGRSLVPQVLKDFAQRQQLPVFSGLPSGHGPIQRPLPLGTPSQLHCGPSPMLVCPTGVRG